MLEVVAEVDGRPLSRWGCDGVVCATPTGSTAYAFSAGGPVVWPEVEALLMVPISAHALFARPLVVAPTSVLAVELVGWVRRASCGATAAARSTSLLGDRVEVRRSPVPLRLARLHRAPFTDRLVAKFALPVEGWRGPVIEELRIRGPGVIDDALLELGPGLTVVTGETGAGKTMVVTALGLLLGGRADAGAVRTGSGRTLVEGRVAVASPTGSGCPGRRGGAELDDGALLLARTVSAEGRSRAHLGGRSVPVGAALRPRAPTSWPSTASPTSSGCCSRPASATRWTATPGEAVEDLLAGYRADLRAAARGRRPSSPRSRA